MDCPWVERLDARKPAPFILLDLILCLFLRYHTKKVAQEESQSRSVVVNFDMSAGVDQDPMLNLGMRHRF